MTLRSHNLAELTTGVGATVWTLVAAIDSNAFQAWGAAIVAVLTALWSFYRQNRQLDVQVKRAESEERRSDQLRAAIDAANLRALKRGRKAPHPEFLPEPDRDRQAGAPGDR